ncbi:flavin containing amine oxidoreductase domain-containing protein [Ditylenchus destructor]|uniref:Flavin containing amine oxidoreductase domain-containing protein n=1 Tax=Ditylenchus destructor TaxID=166010 RepID=A0AAD4R8B5_9BILA|nr:flavin containing amine oxidoreductase domain-containing protein [Ditylenchus destructor]
MYIAAIILAGSIMCLHAGIDLSISKSSRLPDNNFANVSVAIIGAGFAGLSAYRRLLLKGFTNVDIFEASDRVGGRVYPVPFGDGHLQHGAEFINGAANPIFEMARGLGVVSGEKHDATLWNHAVYMVGKCNMKSEQIEAFENFYDNLETEYHQLARDRNLWNITIGELYSRNYKHFIETLHPNPQDESIFDALSRFYRSYYESEWAAEIDELALVNYAKWDDKSDSYVSFTLDKVGYKAVLDHIMEGINASNIHLNSKVSKISYGGREKTTITLSEKGDVPNKYDYVVVTLPLGFLKRHAKFMFDPPLPPNKIAMIEALGFGSLQKLFLVYDRPFWSENVTSLVPLNIEGCSSAKRNPISDYLHTFEPLAWNGSVLVGWLSGNGPSIIDDMTDEYLTDLITEHFRDLLNGINLPRPRKIFRTSWISNPNIYGAYSYITPEAVALSESPSYWLTSPVYHQKHPRILFAGEATHPRLYQTTTGAYLSGIREAERIINYVRKSRT